MGAASASTQHHGLAAQQQPWWVVGDLERVGVRGERRV
jgi:hypothetical protein